MAEDLQGLLDRIHNDGIRKAEGERDKILSEAKEEAERIVAKAKAEAEELMKQAQMTAESSRERAEKTIRQISRDILIALKKDLLDRLNRLAKDCAGQAMTPRVMEELIVRMAQSCLASGGNNISLDICLSRKDAEQLTESLKAALLNDLKINGMIHVGTDFSAGLKVGVTGSDVYLDFSDEALADVICEFAGPKLAAVLKG